MRRAQDFSLTTKTGHRASSNVIVLYFLNHENFPADVQIGLIINKSIGGSVTRHRIARQLRHAMAGHLSKLQPHSQIVIRVVKRSDDYRSDLGELIEKIVKRTGINQ
jgi:ribonuclease P protein component